jgi:L,D-transpeptidase catalytic domain
MSGVGGFGAAAAGGLFRIAVLTAAALTGTAVQAEAALYYWSDDPGYYRPEPTMPQRRQKPWHYQAKKFRVPENVSAKPQGPVIIAISIDKQSLRIYDAKGFFAESPVSTGMKGHSTPMGVFSVIQKQKLHHSNIYSGAPMPYMQRITWSGVAIHAGLLPGYPASHGCIRMPMAFAVKMWNWTRMGARVVITPGEIIPSAFSHPSLIAQKLVPAAPAEPHVDAGVAPKFDKGFVTEIAVVPAISDLDVALRSTAGHAYVSRPVMLEPSIPESLRGQTHTADISVNMPANEGVVAPATSAIEIGLDDVKAEAANPEAPTANGKSREVPIESSTDTLAASVTAVSDTGPTVPEVKKDQAQVPEVERPLAVKSDPAIVSKRAAQIAVFISRRDSKLYVRQNFAPLFEAPVTIAANDSPLGTHVFTAEVDSNDAHVVHWSVVSLPASSPHAAWRDEGERAPRRHKIASAVIEAKPLGASEGPRAALDRITIPEDAMARIAEALSTGASIIVSDESVAGGETGEGTDFIVSLR